MFRFKQNDVLVSEATVPASQAVQSGRINAEVGGAVNTGMAIANPNNAPATISFYFTDSAGRNSAKAASRWPECADRALPE
jgi:hypothetical protein